MRLASRGGRSLTSTRLWLLGGQITYKGACTGPLFYFALEDSRNLALGFPTGLGKLRVCPEKGERPVGVPAALAWGMEGLLFRKLNSLWHRLFDCARQQ